MSPGGLGHLDAGDPLEHVDLAGLALLDDRAVGPHGRQVGRLRDLAREDAPDRQPPQIVRVVDVRDNHLVGSVADDRGGDVLEDRVEERPQVARFRLGVPRDVSQAARAVEDLELQMMLLGRQRQEEVVNLLLHLGRPRVRTVDLVDEHDRPLPALERLLQDEAGLGQGPLRRVDEQQHALDHREDPLDLRAEVPVAGRVDDVDDDVLVVDRRVLGEDRDAPLLLELARVHDEVVHVLADAEGAALLEQRVDESRLAVVDVRHDGDRAAVGPRGGSGDDRVCGGHGEQRSLYRHDPACQPA